MYESKYSKYLIQNTNRFATLEEITDFCKPNKKNSKVKYAGMPILYNKGCLYVDNSDSHYMGIGGTGSKKTRTSVINTLFSIIFAKEHAVVNDPKGELYKKTASVARKEGYNVKVLNLRNPKRSDCWNPMYLPYKMDIEGKKDVAEELLSDFIESLTAPIKENTKDNYWPVRVNSFLYGLSRALMDSVTEEYFNISTLMQVSKKNSKTMLEELIKDCDDKQPFWESLESFMNMSAKNTQDCLYDTIQQAFGPYSSKTSLLNILCENDIDFFDLVDQNKKTIIYIIYPDEKSSMAFFVNLFLSQCYVYLKLYADENNLFRLEKRVNFLCEEFGNLPKVEKFANRISMARGFNIRYFLYLQSYSQLEKIYKEEADTIKSNCDWVVYPSKERSFLKEVSEFCGDVRDHQNSLKPLISIDRIQHLKKSLDGAEAVVIKNGQYPFIVKLPDYEYIDVFEKGEEVGFEEKERDFYNHTLTLNEWICGINDDKFNYPFPKKKRYIDRRIPGPKNTTHSKKTKTEDDIDFELFMEEFRAVLDEIEGTGDDAQE